MHRPAQRQSWSGRDRRGKTARDYKPIYLISGPLTCSARSLQCQLTRAAEQRSRGLRKDITYRDRNRGSTAVKSARAAGTVSVSKSLQHLRTLAVQNEARNTWARTTHNEASPELRPGAAREQSARQALPLPVGPQVEPVEHEVDSLLEQLRANGGDTDTRTSHHVTNQWSWFPTH